jgi:hypothetical protein
MPNPENIEKHKFEKGKSGNPEGRPKGSKNLSTILREMLNEEVEVIVDGKRERKKFQDIIIRKLIKKANSGNLRAIREIFDRVEGKARQFIETNITAMPKPEAQSPDRNELLKEVQAKLDEIDRQGENQKQ